MRKLIIEPRWGKSHLTHLRIVKIFDYVKLSQTLLETFGMDKIT